MENNNMITLADVFNTFVAENDKPTEENLQDWVKRYPQYRRELVDFAAAWAEQLVLPPAPEMGPEAEKALIDRAMSHVRNVAYNRNEQAQKHAESDDPVDSLIGEAQRAGMNAQELAGACGLDRALISKLNRRQFKPESIPAELIGRLGQLLEKSTAEIRAYLTMPSQAATGKAFLAHGKPTSAGQQDFVDAVRASSLSEEEKARWLNNESGEEG